MLILLLLFSFLLTVINNETIAIDENNSSNIFSQLEDITPVITIDCSKQNDGVFSGTVHDENFNLGYNVIKVNGLSDLNYTTYVDASTNEFEIDTENDFEDYTDLLYERHNSISIEARSLIPSSSPYYSFTENGLGPMVFINNFFCDNQECWSGGGGSNFADVNDTSPFINFYFEDYVDVKPGKNPEIRYYTTEPNERIEEAEKNEPIFIKVRNSEGQLSHVKFINVKKDTELKPLEELPIPFNFEAAILGIIISTAAIILIRKRKKK